MQIYCNNTISVYYIFFVTNSYYYFFDQDTLPFVFIR